MNIIVQIPSALRRHTGGASKVTCSATNLNELLSDLDGKFPDLKPHLRDEAGQIRRFLNVYVNEEDIRFLGRRKLRVQGRGRSTAGAVYCRRSRRLVALCADGLTLEEYLLGRFAHQHRV